VFLCGFICIFGATQTRAQDWFKTGTGLGVSKARVGVADFAAKDAPSQPLATLFSDVVRADLEFSGILDLVSKSYNPCSRPGPRPKSTTRRGPQRRPRLNCLPLETFQSTPNNVEIQAWLNDVRDASLPPVIGKVYRGEATESQVRTFAHQFADEIIGKTFRRLTRIASTQIRLCQQPRRQQGNMGHGLRTVKTSIR